MTTNHRDRLDPALIRPGRVDVQAEFGWASQEQARKLFRHFYAGLPVWPVDSAPPAPLPAGTVATLAERFARAVLPRAHSIAALQGHLIRHRHDPHAAVAHVPTDLAGTHA
jgi:mitochondrial chaperone BCS1